METVRVRRHSKDGGKTTGIPLWRSRWHEMTRACKHGESSDPDAQLGCRSVYAPQLL